MIGVVDERVDGSQKTMDTITSQPSVVCSREGVEYIVTNVHVGQGSRVNVEDTRQMEQPARVSARLAQIGEVKILKVIISLTKFLSLFSLIMKLLLRPQRQCGLCYCKYGYHLCCQRFRAFQIYLHNKINDEDDNDVGPLKYLYWGKNEEVDYDFTMRCIDLV